MEGDRRRRERKRTGKFNKLWSYFDYIFLGRTVYGIEIKSERHPGISRRSNLT